MKQKSIKINFIMNMIFAHFTKAENIISFYYNTPHISTTGDVFYV